MPGSKSGDVESTCARPWLLQFLGFLLEYLPAFADCDDGIDQVEEWTVCDLCKVRLKAKNLA